MRRILPPERISGRNFAPGRRPGPRSIPKEGTLRSAIRYTAASAAAIMAASTGLAGLAGPAHAAQSTQTVSCGGQELTVRVNVNKSPNGGWSAAQIVSGGTGHFVPTEFTGSLYDETISADFRAR